MSTAGPTDTPTVVAGLDVDRIAAAVAPGLPTGITVADVV